MKRLIIILKSLVLIFGFHNYSLAFVSAPAPTSGSVLSQMSSSLSHSAVNTSSTINNSANITSNIISSSDLKADIKETAEKFDLKVDDEAAQILSEESTSSSTKEEIKKNMDVLQDNIDEKEHENVMVLDQDTIVYDSGWMDLEKVENGSNGLIYSTDNNVFDENVTQQARGKVYVNFKKKEISADMYSRITLKGGTQKNYEWNSGTAGITSIPIVASTVRSLNADGTTEFDEFVGTQPSMQVNSSTLAPVFDDGFNTQEQMDRFNHDTTPGDAEKKVFFYAKFTTVDLGKFTGTGTVAVEGAHDNVSDPSVENGTANYINTIERLEGAGTIVGKKLK